MRRIAHVEIDKVYFDHFGPAFFKSFYRYNRGWKLFVADLGLRDDQREILSRYGEVRSYNMDQYRRWGQLSARVSSWHDALKADDLMIHLDVDAVVLDSFEPEVEEMLDGEYDICGSRGRHGLVKSARNRHGAEELLGLEPDSSIFLYNQQIHAGWLLMRGTEQMISALCWLKENWAEYNIHTTEEETGLAGIVYARKLKFNEIAIVDCPTLRCGDSNYFVPCMQPPSMFHNGLTKFFHFAHSRYFTDQTSAGESHETYMAWRHVLIEPYAELPWPDPEIVCECS